MIILIALIGSLSASLFVIFIYYLLRNRKNVNVLQRLRRHTIAGTKPLRETEDFIRRIYLFLQHTAKPIADWNIAKNLDFKLKQAGIPIFGAEFIIIITVGAFVVTIAVYVITLNISAAPMAGLAVPITALLIIRARINKRRQAFTEQLGDCLTTVSNALRAGYSFQQAMDVVAREMEPPISSEFERVATDVAMGVSLEDALEQMNKRVGSADFDLVVTAVLIQREIGGNLAQILDTISYTINERIRMKREINALTAQGRFSSYVLVVLPFIVAAFCWVFNHDQMQLFITEESGRIAIVAALVMEIIGYLLIQRIVDIEL